MTRGEDIAYDLVLVLLSISLLILAIVLIIICRRKPAKSDDHENQLEPPVKLVASSYQLTDIDAATDGFNHRRIIGKGRLGTVYAAISPRGELVAVKRIHPQLVLSNAGFGLEPAVKSRRRGCQRAFIFA
ncbi:hypothetical protein CCACVL1_15733 [Corchorus capsularis]|uniref:Protein kinase domain-containing protein n=1 Tax=Corchorus capsularis TaxID=210143 RepID=A0A1R3I152_COCAP|nr:hypothetical protein CCACVL1_15733 [Corchorus capsularis]